MRFILGVSALVGAEMTPVREGLPALRAAVRLLSCVDAPVCLKVTLVREALTAL